MWYETFFDDLYIKWQDNFDENYQYECEKDANDIYEYLGIKNTDKILDLCCGCGYHSIEFGKKGNNVVGMDLSKKMLEYAKYNAHNFKNIQYIEQDIRSPINDKFDFVFCFNTSLGYFDNDYELENIFGKMYRAINLNGKFLIDVFNPFKFINNFKENLIFDIEGLSIYQKSKINLVNQEVQNSWTARKAEGSQIIDERTMKIRFYTAKELIKFGNNAGFKFDRLIGDYKGKEYKVDSDRLILVLKK
ncbi:class I SAM-dependent methyltransferase [Paraliobacillus sp. X-1268]|uniref:class I SAM-dependent DNA methyltransferase n=1 Tax=Paraliobacillus sp. X-1268 TaxID=2213193 RepID=UPI000E3E6CA8|nr:class I SAM-dependent methyltransferase [Paraliobacillus sp. X-1268]